MVNPRFKTLHMKPCMNTHNAAHPAGKNKREDLASADQAPGLKPEVDDRLKNPATVCDWSCMYVAFLFTATTDVGQY